ncbi:MAG: mechanosensitive ion channel family protein [Lachnospiraceae bacterium]|nr:mechanosensitive ion channel family protein [Lachnospiraceae bacterium]
MTLESIINSGPFKNFVDFIMTAAITALIVIIILTIGKMVFRKYLHSDTNIYMRFTEHTLKIAIVAFAVMGVIADTHFTAPFGKLLFQGTAIIGAIAGIAAQPVIADLICGFMISTNKPFDIGDRIELENDVAGVVKDITVRHVVIRTIDTIDLIIPNSKINAMAIKNMSYSPDIRSVNLKFHVDYSTDIKLAAKVIQDAVKSSEYSIEKPTEDENAPKEYSPVYFLSYEASSLCMSTTVYFTPDSPTEVVKNDINTRVKEALKNNNIEIPYDYVNVLMKDQES